MFECLLDIRTCRSFAIEYQATKVYEKAFGREEKAMLKKNAVLVYVCYIYGKDCTGIYEMGARLWNRVSLFV